MKILIKQNLIKNHINTFKKKWLHIKFTTGNKGELLIAKHLHMGVKESDKIQFWTFPKICKALTKLKYVKTLSNIVKFSILLVNIGQFLKDFYIDKFEIILKFWLRISLKI